MDDLDTVGKYGTISLIRKNTLEAITSYPVDDERTTFGRDPKCSIRMYFHAVDPLHCVLYFDDGKAYLEVHGSDGVTVDDVLVPSGSTVALNNASKFMIWRKLFSFTYPPREIRSILMTSPRKANSKSLRMSMIHSAVIMTPRANARTQTLDLRTLQSPLKPYKEAPNEVVTFVDSDQIAVVEDNCVPRGTTAGSSVLEAEEEQDRSLVALEEIDYDENAVEDPVFSRSPIKRVPTGSPFTSSQQQPSTPFRALTPTLHRRTSTHAQVPPLSSVKSPVPTFLPPSASPSAPRLLSPGRPLQSSSLVPRDQWRQSVFTPQPPRTPPKRKQARMSMHKAVLVRSAHRLMMAAAKEREEKEEEDEVEEGVSPERKAEAVNFGSAEPEAGDDDAEGEDDFELRTGQGVGCNEEADERPESTPSSGVLQVGANLFSSLSTFVRKSLSPERRSASGEPHAGIADHESEDGEITDQASVSPLLHQPDSTEVSDSTGREQPHSRPEFVFNFKSNAKEGLKPVHSSPNLPPQRSPVRPLVRFNFAPFQVLGATREEVVRNEEETVKSTEEDITDAQDVDVLAKSASPITRHDSNPFYTPQVTRVLPLQTNTVDRPQAPGFDGEMPKLNTFWSKPIRPRKSLEPSAPFAQSLIQITPSKPHMLQQAPDEEENVGDDENAKRERELRAQRRKSLLAAMDATPRHLTDPSTRKSAVLAGASKRREGSLVPGSPSKTRQPDSLHEVDNNLALGQPHAAVAPEPTLVDFTELKSKKGEDLTARLLLEEESDVSSAFEEAIEPVADALDVLKANVARARRESAFRAARLSHGGGLLDTPAHISTPSETFDSQNTAEGAETQPLDLAGLLSTDHVELPSRELSSSNATPTGEEGLEVDITEAQAELTEVQADVTKEFNVAEEMKQETVDVEEEVTKTRRATKRTPSPFKRDTVEQSPTRTTRGTKRSAAVEEESSVAKRSTRRRVQETQDDDAQDNLVEEAPRPLRRGRTKAKGAPSTSSTITSTRPSRATATNPTAGPSTRVAGVVPRIRNNSVATTSAIPSKRTAGDTDRQTNNNTGTRVKRSTRPDPDQGVDDEEDSSPRKRRKAAATVKEEEPDEPRVPSGSLARKTSASRLPSALPTANRRAPATTKKTPSNRKGAADHDKENTPETAEDQATGKASAGKTTKAAKIPAASTRSRSVATASNQEELAAHSGGRSRRERPKK
ncbi:hypothetical protein FS837_002938 [Tulasnella sp. UAMH 9824]|nr:hypothetical protein FS837_002938 [Tulasnella sp. UAMH 9824]